MDEQLEHEVEPLVRGAADEGRTEHRQTEAPGEEEGGMGHRPEVDDPAFGPTEDALEAREELARHLRPRVFPADADRLIETALEMHAPPPVLNMLERLPRGRTFENVQQVWSAVGGDVEHRRL
jgi:hypothetical protein